ncbi:ABC transporter permease [Microbacterium telephonicum]|uniref:Peptide/nickel transport system permease protein n=1 Tax=Microbacterium telephonicum TaxID=1714841 RepID=A0A498CC80_9MICO|nr:ABC transporter permease [Microbacterium telephonicum]RLK52679.1 peptide/nickel transport system permease protein [Microbacterium telephonicum]
MTAPASTAPASAVPLGSGRAPRRAPRWILGVARPVAVFVPVFLLATFVTYLLRDISGLSPAHIQLGENATPELVAQVEHDWGVDRPFWQQYLDWMTGLLHGDLGKSWWNGTDIATILFDKALVSLSVAGFALLIGVVVGSLLGIVAALTATSPLDRIITGFTTAMSVMPPFVVGVALVAVFAVGLGWFPSAGYSAPAEGGVALWLWYITLPAVALSFDTIADVARQLRTGLTAASRENYVVGARVRGFSPQRVFTHHVLRNGIGPAVTVLGMKFPALLGGAVVTEAIFGLSGYGQFAADSALRGDVPAVQGALVVSIVLVVVFNLLVNIVLGRLSPAAQRGV